MNLTYVETYLTNVERDGRGWPTGLPVEEQIALTDAARGLLANSLASFPAFPIGDIYHHLHDDPELCARCPVWGKAVVLDWLYACVHRALLAVGAHEVWRLE